MSDEPQYKMVNGELVPLTPEEVAAIEADARQTEIMQALATPPPVGSVADATVDLSAKVPLSPNAPRSIVSLALSPGDWEISASGYFEWQSGEGEPTTIMVGLTSARDGVISGAGYYAETVIYDPGVFQMSIQPITVKLVGNEMRHLTFWHQNLTNQLYGFGHLRAKLLAPT